MVTSEVRIVLEKIYNCALKANSPECCEHIFNRQKNIAKNVEIGFTPSPILGDRRAPIVFIATNPGFRADDLTYDSLRRYSKSKAFDGFINYVLHKHDNIDEEDYKYQTSKARNAVLKKIANLIDLPSGSLSIKKGAAFCINVVQCPTDKWKTLAKERELSAIEMTCSGKHLKDLLNFSNPKIVIAAGKSVFNWLMNSYSMSDSVVKCTVNWTEGVQVNDGKYLRIKENNMDYYIVTIPFQYIPLKDYGLIDCLIKSKFISSEDFDYMLR